MDGKIIVKDQKGYNAELVEAQTAFYLAATGKEGRQKELLELQIAIQKIELSRLTREENQIGPLATQAKKQQIEQNLAKARKEKERKDRPYRKTNGRMPVKTAAQGKEDVKGALTTNPEGHPVEQKAPKETKPPSEVSTAFRNPIRHLDKVKV